VTSRATVSVSEKSVVNGFRSSDIFSFRDIEVLFAVRVKQPIP